MGLDPLFFRPVNSFTNLEKLAKIIGKIYKKIARHRGANIVRLRESLKWDRSWIMKHKKSVVATLTLISQLGISMIVPVFLCIFVGIKLEEKFDIALTIPFIILGILAGIRNVYALVKQATDTMNSEKDED